MWWVFPGGCFFSSLLAEADADARITGMPVLDLWINPSEETGHIAAALQVLDADGHETKHALVLGQRSLNHLDPMPDDWFRQTEPRTLTPGVPVRVPVRFWPSDLIGRKADDSRCVSPA